MAVSQYTFDAIRYLRASTKFTNITELRPMRGLCNISRRFTPNLRRIAASQNRKLPIDHPTPFEKLAKDEFIALETLQQTLITPPVLSLPRSMGTSTLDNNVSHRQAGFVLLQHHPEPSGKTIGYRLRSVNDAQLTDDTTHMEFLATVWALSLLRPYLKGTD